MPRKPLVRTHLFPYHVTTRSNNKDWFDVDQDIAWREVNNILYLSSILYEIRVHAFVLMSNHYHLIASTPNSNLDDFMRYFNRETSKAFNRMSGRENHQYGKRYSYSMIADPVYYAQAYKYIYLNPLRAQICDDVLEYKYSTLHGLMGLSPLLVPLHYPENGINIFVPENLLEQVEWISSRLTEEHTRIIKKALSKKEYKIVANHSDRLLPKERYII